MYTKHRAVEGNEDIKPDTRAWHRAGAESSIDICWSFFLICQASQTPGSEWRKPRVFQPVPARGEGMRIMEKSLLSFSPMSINCLQIKADEGTIN